MKVYLNNKEIELENHSNLLLLLEEANLIKPSIAVAVNNTVVQKSKWNEYILNDNDKITIIKAVFGG